MVVFVNRARIGPLFLDGDCFVMIAKRLARGMFAVARSSTPSLVRERDELMSMLEGNPSRCQEKTAFFTRLIFIVAQSCLAQLTIGAAHDC